MVQILPPKTNLGTQIGQALGGGLGQGMQQGADIGLQRGMLRSGLSQVSEMANNPNVSPFQRNLAILEALSGIPGSERYIGQILPQLNDQMLTQALFGQGGQMNQGAGQNQRGYPNQPQGQGGQPPFAQQSAQFGEQPASSITSPGVPQPGQPTTGGVLPRVVPAETISRQAQQAMQQTGDPNAAKRVNDYYTIINTNAKNAREEAQKKLIDSGIPANEISEAMRIGERFGYMHNLDDWAISTKRDFEEYRDRKRTLDKAFVPGFFQSLVRSGDSREKVLDRLNSPVQDLVKMGFEPEVRKKLSSEGLSPTEIEARIHPISKETKNKINSLPSGQFKMKTLPDVGKFITSPTAELTSSLANVGNDYETQLTSNPQKIQKQNNMLADFFKKNLSPNDSLLVFRDKLVREKGYDWRQVADAINQARSSLNLTAAQANEISEIETQPPRQSLSDIFMDWDRAGDILMGKR